MGQIAGTDIFFSSSIRPVGFPCRIPDIRVDVQRSESACCSWKFLHAAVYHDEKGEPELKLGIRQITGYLVPDWPGTSGRSGKRLTWYRIQQTCYPTGLVSGRPVTRLTWYPADPIPDWRGIRHPGTQLTWYPTNLVSDRPGTRLTWYPADLRSDWPGIRLIWYPTHLASDWPGIRLTWYPTDLVSDWPGIRHTWYP